MNKEFLITELSKLNIALSIKQMEQIEQFCQFLITENKKYNLTALTNYEDILLKHVYDSLTLVKVVDFKQINHLLDIGSGAGFPGIILKIVYPHLAVTLLDANGKKTSFLNQAKALLQLDNLEIINERAEVYGQRIREYYDLVTARAVASLNILIELAIPLTKVGGVFIAMKGNVQSELDLGQVTCPFLNCKIMEMINLTLPVENSARTLVVIKKLKKTAKEYPRRYEKILKKPLKSAGK